MKLLPVALALLTALVPACASERRAVPVEKTSGVVLTASPDMVWAEAKRTLARLGQDFRANESSRTARAYVGLGSVTVRVEPKGTAGTQAILRVSAEASGTDAPDTAEKVRLHIQRAVLER